MPEAAHRASTDPPNRLRGGYDARVRAPLTVFTGWYVNT
jgi:hypothetical protein